MFVTESSYYSMKGKHCFPSTLVV